MQTMMMNIQAFAKEWDMLPPGALILCAVSGGRDSMALLHLLTALAEEGGFRVHAAHFNHHLRPTADRDEDFVRRWCGDRGIPLTCGGGDAAAFAKAAGTSLEDGARQLRYRFLEETADQVGAARIATAHHREDNAETVLLHLLRGAGLQGLSGIPPVRGKIVRPLLEAGRADIDAYVERNGLPYVEDESNRDTAYTRNRLRLEVLPLLEEIVPGCGGRIAAAAALLREENAHIQREVQDLLPAVERDIITIPVTVLYRQDEVLRRRLVRAMGESLGVSLARGQTDAVLSLGSGKFLDLPGSVCAVRKPHQLILKRQAAQPAPLPLHLGGQTWGSWRVTLERRGEPAGETPCRVVLRDMGGELAIASWDGTGRMAVENGSRTVKRLFADAGVPVERRAEHPVILVDGELAAVFGVATDWKYQMNGAGNCWVVTIEAEEAAE